MFESTRLLYAELATALGVESLPADENGSLQLNIGEQSSVVMFAEDEFSLMILSAVMPLPRKLDYGRMLWLLRRGFHDSPIAPFRVSCDKAGTLVVWGRVPITGMGGEALAGMLDALGSEADLIRDEMTVDETDDDDGSFAPVAPQA
jgi:hypothetical protein